MDLSWKSKGFKFSGPGMMGLVYQVSPLDGMFYIDSLGCSWMAPMERQYFSEETITYKLKTGELVRYQEKNK